MKHKLIAFLLALTISCWAQTATPNPTPEQKSTPANPTSACPCCDKMSEHTEAHEGMACMRHRDANDAKPDKQSKKEAMSCCAGKDAKNSCCAGMDGKACSKDGKPCGDKSADGKEMACCAQQAGKGHECCGGMQCGKHDSHEHVTPGN